MTRQFFRVVFTNVSIIVIYKKCVTILGGASQNMPYICVCSYVKREIVRVLPVLLLLLKNVMVFIERLKPLVPATTLLRLNHCTCKAKNGYQIIWENKNETRKGQARLIVGYSANRAKKDRYNREKGVKRLEKAYRSGSITKKTSTNAAITSSLRYRIISKLP